MKIFTYITISVVAIMVIIGLYTSGSPAQARLEREDMLREEHLQQLTFAITDYALNKEELPESIDLIQNYTLHANLVDPKTGEPYEYRILGENSFELCANFALKSTYPQRYSEYNLNDSWIVFQIHEAGRNCFERNVDKRDNTLIR